MKAKSKNKVIRQLYLKIQEDAMRLENVLNFKRSERNNLLDVRKKAKKDKDADVVAECTRKINMAEQDILDMENRMRVLENEFNELQHRIGKIRLNLYIFADVIYNTLVEYKEFRDKYVINKDGDDEVVNSLQTAIDCAKKLPFELAGDGYLNDVYSVVTDKFIERWECIRDGVVLEVLREVDGEMMKNKK